MGSCVKAGVSLTFSRGGVDMAGSGSAELGAALRARSGAGWEGGDAQMVVVRSTDGRGGFGTLRSRSQPSANTKHVNAAVVRSKALGMGPSYRACLTYTPNVDARPNFSIDQVAEPRTQAC